MSLVTLSKTLHYAYPLAVIVYFVSALLVSSCLLHNGASKKKGDRKQFFIRLAFMLVVLLTYLADAAVLIRRTLFEEREWFAPRDQIIYVISTIFAWGVIVLAFVDSKPRLQYPYVGCWVIGAVSELILTGAAANSRAHVKEFGGVVLALHATRVFTFAALLVTTVQQSRCCEISRRLHKDEEHQPLLADADNQSQHGSITKQCKQDDAEADDEGSESDPEEDAMAKKKRKRLEESGSWWTYLKAYLVFLPYVWPAGNRWLQFLLGIQIVAVLAQRALNVLVPRQLGIIADALTGHNPSAPWKEVAIWMLLSLLNSSAGFSLLEGLTGEVLKQYSYRRITNAAFARVLSLSMDFHNDKDSAELTKGIDQGRALGDILDLALFEVFPVGFDIAIAVGYFSFMYDAYAGLIVAAVLVAYTWVGVKSNTVMRAAGRKYSEKAREEWRILHEAVDDWQTVSYFNRIEHEKVRMAKAVDETLFYDWRCMTSMRIGASIQSFVATLGLFGTSFVVVYRISKGLQPVGAFVTMSAYWGVVLSPVRRLQYAYSRLSRLLIDAERLLQLLRTNPTVHDKEDAVPLQVDAGVVDFKGVGFAYDPRKQTLKDITFTADGGQTVAFVGETGAGKSTILKLLFRFYDVTEGTIRIDGQDLRDITQESLRDVLGVVPQDPSLFNISILENVRYARLGASDEEVHEACRAAAMHDKILTFPDGYNSKVGHRGIKLSGGELQRVAIARALLKNSRIVMLDEATSSVDTETEQQIQAAFHQLSKGRTTFVIAHRLSTIVRADLILVIGDGKVIERGTHEELLQGKGKYYNMWSKQISKVPGEDTSAQLIVDLPQDNLRASQMSQVGLNLMDSSTDSADSLQQVDGAHDQAKQPKTGIRSKVDAIKAKMFNTGALEYESSKSVPREDESPTEHPMRRLSPRPTETEPAVESAISTQPEPRRRRLGRRRKGKAPASEPALRSYESDDPTAVNSKDTETVGQAAEQRPSTSQSTDATGDAQPKRTAGARFRKARAARQDGGHNVHDESTDDGVDTDEPLEEGAETARSARIRQPRGGPSAATGTSKARVADEAGAKED